MAIGKILILNLTTNIYKSNNNYCYQQKTTNLTTIKLLQTNIKGKTTNLTTIKMSQTNIKEKLQMLQQKTTNVTTKN